MKIDIRNEIIFQTARSGGKGGQHVNKVETMVEGRWSPAASKIVSEEQKEMLLTKLAGRITSEGFLLVKSQTERTQLGNKEQVIKKLNALISLALVKKKLRIATAPGKIAREKRMENKKQKSWIKANRKSVKPGDL